MLEQPIEDGPDISGLRSVLYGLAMSFNEFQMQSITGEPVEFSQFDDQVSLVVNVASK